MSFNTVHTCAQDEALIGRVAACAAKENADPPDSVARSVIWDIAAAADIESAYASALAGGNPNPGGDEAVITDGMILSAFQANWPPTPPAGALAVGDAR